MKPQYAKQCAGAAEFWAKVHKTATCWLWTGDKDRKGYGRVRRRAIAKRTVQAHRYAWLITHGTVPDDKCVLHRCDNTSCVRPDHLVLGTHQENMDDMWRKGRGNPGHVFGAKQGSAKLTDKKALQIRALVMAGVVMDKVAAQFGIARSTVGRVAHGITWKHLP